jgi:hypothetical protein
VCTYDHKIVGQREHAADEREKIAGQRELAADERELRLNELEQRLDARAGMTGVPTATAQERARETVERGRALLAASLASLDRSETALDRADARNHRNQQEIQRETEAAVRDSAQVSVPAEPSAPPTGQRLARLAEAEEGIARTHEQRAAQRPALAEECQQSAETARVAARRARDIATQFKG